MERDKDFVYLGRFIWDTDKEAYNIAKHKGLPFKAASLVFKDPLLVTVYDDAHSLAEDREKNIGKIEGRYIATVISTDRNGLTRIISARKATTTEVKLYEENAKRIRGY